MAKENSFDAVVECDMQEVDNAVNQAIKEIGQRWDFRGSISKIELDKTAKQIKLLADDDMKMTALKDVLASKMIKRGLSPSAVEWKGEEEAAGASLRETGTVVEGIPQDKAKKMVQAVKDAKLKVQASIQGDKVRVSAKSKDLLQEAVSLFKKQDLDLDLKFTNYR